MATKWKQFVASAISQTFTVLAMLIMASIAAPVAEEATFRVYCWTILERQFRPISVFVLSSLLFALDI